MNFKHVQRATFILKPTYERSLVHHSVLSKNGYQFRECLSGMILQDGLVWSMVLLGRGGSHVCYLYMCVFVG